MQRHIKRIETWFTCDEFKRLEEISKEHDMSVREYLHSFVLYHSINNPIKAKLPEIKELDKLTSTDLLKLAIKKLP